MNGICSKCKVAPSLSYHCYCKVCHNDRQKLYYQDHPRSTDESLQRRRQETRELVQRAKDVPCMDCGIKYPRYVMDLDHVRGKKKFNLSRATSHMHSLESILAEIEKCDVVCANCHRSRTFNRALVVELADTPASNPGA
jgi:hypothetical protein